MTDHQIITKYFPELTECQRQRFEQLGLLYRQWNEKVNVISRKDIDNLYPHHVLHSLAVAKLFSPVAGSEILDLGTGGGFPGIPLAIIWPDVKFHLIDRIGKKVKVATEIANSLGLCNVTFQHGDVGECHRKFDFVVTRGVTDMERLLPMSRRLISHKQRNKLHNGLICLKGGDLDGELSRAGISPHALEQPIAEWFAEPFFETKKLIYIPV